MVDNNMLGYGTVCNGKTSGYGTILPQYALLQSKPFKPIVWILLFLMSQFSEQDELQTRHVTNRKCHTQGYCKKHAVLQYLFCLYLQC